MSAACLDCSATKLPLDENGRCRTCRTIALAAVPSTSSNGGGNGSAPVELPIGCPPPPLDEVLDEVAGFVRRFVVMSEAQADAVALWVVHTHAFDAAEQTPYLAISSAEKRSGKTRLLEVLELLVARPWLTGRVTAAVLARKVDAERPTLLLDESDAAFKGEKEYAEALRGLLEYRPPPRRQVNGVCRPGRGAVLQGLLHLLPEGDRGDREAARHGCRPLATDPAGATGTRRAGGTVPPARCGVGGRAASGGTGAARRTSRSWCRWRWPARASRTSWTTAPRTPPSRCSPSPTVPVATGPDARVARSSSCMVAGRSMTSRPVSGCWPTSRRSSTAGTGSPAPTSSTGSTGSTKRRGATGTASR